MADVLVRGIDGKTLKLLKQRAKRSGRSLQGEARLILENAAGAGGDEVAQILGRWKSRFAGRKFSGSSTLIREDRGR